MHKKIFLLIVLLLPGILRAGMPKEPVRGIHLTAWVAGSSKARARIDKLIAETEINAIIIAIKEYEGQVYIPGVPEAHRFGTYQHAIPEVQKYIQHLKSKGVYTIARIVVFKDTALASKVPAWAVKRPDGSVWKDRKGNAWADPYNRQVWDYNIAIATQAVALGFDEIQFDYIRFPSDGDTKQCRYSYANHSSSASAKALADFLTLAVERIRPLGVPVAIDVFGLTPSVQHDMGIGQKINQLTDAVDFVSPMVYPSHYAKGEYGIPEPNREPYRVVHKTVSDAKKRLGDKISRLRPYLQDFSMGHKYGPVEVRAQIEACEDQGIMSWMLWDPNCRYTRNALKRKDGTLPEEARVPESMKVRSKERASAKSPVPAVSSGTVVPVNQSTAPMSVPEISTAPVFNLTISTGTPPETAVSTEPRKESQKP